MDQKRKRKSTSFVEYIICRRMYTGKKEGKDVYYSEDVIEEVRMKNDIIDVISSYVRLQKKGNSYFG